MSAKSNKSNKKGSPKLKRAVSSRTARHRAILRALKNYNKKASKSSKLGRKDFWTAYGLAKSEFSKEPTRGLIGKISIQNWSQKLASYKQPISAGISSITLDPSKRARRFPPQLFEGIAWYDIIEVIYSQGLGYFQEMDVLLFNYEDLVYGGSDAFAFFYDDLTSKGDVVLYSELKAYKGFYDTVLGFSPPPEFLYNQNESIPSEGIFVWDLDTYVIPPSTANKPSKPTKPTVNLPKKPKTVDDIVNALDEETLKEFLRQGEERIRQIEADKKGKKRKK